jgi:hypothetical protein
MSIELNNKEKNLVNKKKELEKLLKLYNKKLDKINKILDFKKSIYEDEKYMSQIDNNYEKPMPLIYNKITEKNLNKDKSCMKTKQLINKLIKRKIKIKKENIDRPSSQMLYSVRPISQNGSVDDILNIKIPDFKEKEIYISDDYKYNDNKKFFQDDQKENDINRIIVKEEFEIPPLEIVI